MKETRRPLATTSHQAVDRAEVAMGAAEVSRVDMGAVGVNNHPNTEEVTTTILQATTPPLHKATVSRASMVVKVEVRDGFIFTFY